MNELAGPMPAPRASRNEAMEDAALRLRRVLAAMRGRFAGALGEAGLTFPQWMLLKALSRRGRMTAREVAEALDCTPANATGIIDRLERDGLAARSRSDEDRRVVYVRLTERGHRKVEEVVGLAPRAVEDMFEGWTARDFDEFRAALGKLRLRPEDPQDF